MIIKSNRYFYGILFSFTFLFSLICISYFCYQFKKLNNEIIKYKKRELEFVYREEKNLLFERIRGNIFPNLKLLTNNSETTMLNNIINESFANIIILHRTYGCSSCYDTIFRFWRDLMNTTEYHKVKYIFIALNLNDEPLENLLLFHKSYLSQGNYYVLEKKNISFEILSIFNKIDCKVLIVFLVKNKFVLFALEHNRYNNEEIKNLYDNYIQYLK